MHCGFATQVLANDAVVGKQLTGFIFRCRAACDGHMTPGLSVRCLVTCNGAPSTSTSTPLCPTAHVLLAFDLLGLGPAALVQVESTVQQQGVPKALQGGHARVVCVSTHTHSAPAAIHLERCGDIDPAFVTTLASAAAAATKAAFSKLAPVASLR